MPNAALDIGQMGNQVNFPDLGNARFLRGSKYPIECGVGFRNAASPLIACAKSAQRERTGSMRQSSETQRHSCRTERRPENPTAAPEKWMNDAAALAASGNALGAKQEISKREGRKKGKVEGICRPRSFGGRKNSASQAPFDAWPPARPAAAKVERTRTGV